MNTTSTRSTLVAAISPGLFAGISPAIAPLAKTPPPTAHPFAEMLRQAHGEAPVRAAIPAPTPAPAPAPQRPPAHPAAERHAAKVGAGEHAPADAATAADRSGDDAAAEASDAAAGTAALKARTRLAPPPGKHIAADRRADAAAATPAQAQTAAAEAAAHASASEDRRGSSSSDSVAGSTNALPPGVFLPARLEMSARGAGATDSADSSTDIADASVADGGPGAVPSDVKSQRHRISSAESGTEASPFGPHVAVREEKAAAAAQALASQAQRVEGASPRAATGFDHAAAIAALAQSVASPSPSPFAAAASPAATQAYVPASVGSQAFAAAFGVQVSVLAQDGVQRAELHLNPAEMGPVAIRIRIEGREARIDFGAEVAATRQAIEDSLPQLAGALNDAGFTLAGGGVSQHTGQQPRGGEGRDHGDGEEARSGRRGDRRLAMPVGAEAIAKLASRMSARMAAGGVDLYA